MLRLTAMPLSPSPITYFAVEVGFNNTIVWKGTIKDYDQRDGPLQLLGQIVNEMEYGGGSDDPES